MSATSSVTSSSSVAAPDASLVLFARGVIARLALWPALRLAIEQSWGGPESTQKRTWMASVIVDAFDPAESPKPPDVYYVEENLLQMMADEFDAVLEDGSAESVAKDICTLWGILGDTSCNAKVKRWEEQAEALKGKKVAHKEEIADDSDWSDDSDSGEEDGNNAMDEDAPALLEPQEERKKEEPEIDEDGFTLVKGKGKDRR